MAGGLLAAAGLAGLLHDAGNLALTQLAATTTAASAALAVMLTAKWMVNLAGLLWVAATVAAATGSAMSTRLRVAGRSRPSPGSPPWCSPGRPERPARRRRWNSSGTSSTCRSCCGTAFWAGGHCEAGDLDWAGDTQSGAGAGVARGRRA